MTKKSKQLNLEIKSIKAEEFVGYHPGMIGHDDRSGVLIGRYIACKNGHGEPANMGGTINVYEDDKDYEKWRNSPYFDPEDVSEFDIFPSIDVPYKEYYGYEWEPHHICYWVEVTWFLYTGDFELIEQPYVYHGFSGVDLTGFSSYEEAWVAAAKWVKENLGDFGSYDFYTDEERRSHKEEEPFLFEDADERGFHRMERNPLWKSVHQGTLNNRWFKWFTETEYFKEHWTSTFSSDEAYFSDEYKKVLDRI